MDPVSRLPEFRQKCSQELDRCMKFWLDFSHDKTNGGFFNCLGQKGDLFDDLKYGWLQGRQVWTYSRLYNEVQRFKTKEILEAAMHGAEFLMKYIKDPKTSRCFFSVTKDGHPVKLQRTIFTECFYVMGLSELARATANAKYKKEAIDMMNLIIHWVQVDDSALGIQKLPGVTTTNGMAVPMMLLCLVHQMETMDAKYGKEYAELGQWCIKQILAHVQRNGTRILENISLHGKELPGCQGRQMIPGHAIECGWFLLQHAIKTNDTTLQRTAIEKFMVLPMEYGWDKTHGGLYYFLDVDGFSPTQLEWNMKLWWPHNEALIASLMAYKQTGQIEYLENFQKVFDYSWKNFTDTSCGEWFGYLNQQGDVNAKFKGGPWKGCFHVPRCLLMCEQMLNQLLADT